ncbi:hypothetical protein [Pectinatus cerevisiiphilus]|nr:hypothetical protein [Pectinatus cerevisiiphilus]
MKTFVQVIKTIKKIDYVNAALDDNGIINTPSIFLGMMEVLKVEDEL